MTADEFLLIGKITESRNSPGALYQKTGNDIPGVPTKTPVAMEQIW